MDFPSTVVTAVAALIGAFLGSIGRPIAEDRVARWREARLAGDERAARSRARIERVATLLEDGRPDARRQLTFATAAVNDERLTEAVGRYRSGEEGAHNDALWRTGELLREADEALIKR
jgi:hypothetical protein